jgi:hypothetical protein
VEASTDDVAVAQTFGTTLIGASTTATEQGLGVAEGHPFAVVLVRGSGNTDQRVTASMGATTDTVSSVAVPGGTGWVAALALPLAPGATTLPTGIGVGWSPAAGGSERLAPQLTLTEQAPTATTPIPNGQNCGSPTPTTVPGSGSGECLKLQVPGASTASCPKTTLPPMCPYVNPGGPAETVKPGTAVPQASPGVACACATTTTAVCSVPSCPATPATAPCPLAPACQPDTTCTPTPEPGVAGGGSGSSSGSTSSGSTGPVN